MLLGHQPIDGVLLVGQPGGSRDLGEEETNAAVLLAEQLAITLGVGLLHADRLAAERRALQGEKLATLGLVASSIAHEVKNPLSSIKTIATVLAEDLGPDDPPSQDVRLIREEIDRLSATTTRLLRFARPAPPDPARPVSVADVLAGTLHVMGYLARERGVTMNCCIDEELPAVSGEEDSSARNLHEPRRQRDRGGPAGGAVAPRPQPTAASSWKSRMTAPVCLSPSAGTSLSRS